MISYFKIILLYIIVCEFWDKIKEYIKKYWLILKIFGLGNDKLTKEVSYEKN